MSSNDSSNQTQRWIPIALQTVALVTGFVVFAIANEHRITSMESKLETVIVHQAETRETLRKNQEVMIELLKELTSRKK